MTERPNIRLLMPASDGFAELFEPQQALLDTGHSVTLASIDLEPIEGVAGTLQGGMVRQSIRPDLRLEDVNAAASDA